MAHTVGVATNTKTQQPARAHTHAHTRRPGVVWDCQGLSRHVRLERANSKRDGAVVRPCKVPHALTRVASLPIFAAVDVTFAGIGFVNGFASLSPGGGMPGLRFHVWCESVKERGKKGGGALH